MSDAPTAYEYILSGERVEISDQNKPIVIKHNQGTVHVIGTKLSIDILYNSGIVNVTGMLCVVNIRAGKPATDYGTNNTVYGPTAQQNSAPPQMPSREVVLQRRNQIKYPPGQAIPVFSTQGANAVSLEIKTAKPRVTENPWNTGYEGTYSPSQVQAVPGQQGPKKSYNPPIDNGTPNSKFGESNSEGGSKVTAPKPTTQAPSSSFLKSNKDPANAMDALGNF
jgi:hypothetical protein